MSSSDTCKVCGNWMMFARSHQCPPMFEVVALDGGFGDDDQWEYAGKFYASDAQAAAEEFADRYDSEGDYTIIRGSDLPVEVRARDGEITRWTVSGESVPQYTAHAEEPTP